MRENISAVPAADSARRDWLSDFGEEQAQYQGDDEADAATGLTVDNDQSERQNDYHNLTGAFVPLSETFDPSSLADASVVRVVLSRSALDSFGLHLGQAEDAQVVADLIVTNDGTPQAIHVVSW